MNLLTGFSAHFQKPRRRQKPIVTIVLSEGPIVTIFLSERSNDAFVAVLSITITPPWEFHPGKWSSLV